MRYTQLTREERYQIYILKKTGHPQKEIAHMLGRHKSTIGRELRRNRGCRGYRPKQAHERAVARRGTIPNAVSIDDRPAIVDIRKRFGDWEGDTVIGKGHKGALVTLVERKSLYTVIRSVLNKTAGVVRAAVKEALTPHKDRVHT